MPSDGRDTESTGGDAPDLPPVADAGEHDRAAGDGPPAADVGNILRELPAVHEVAETDALRAVSGDGGAELRVMAARDAVEATRRDILRSASVGDGDALKAVLAQDRAQLRKDVEARAVGRLKVWLEPRPRPVINATGVVLHTNLGRAPVSHRAAEAMRRAAAEYSDLEYDLAAGGRGSRHELLVDLLQQLTGAEAALVVNNNAGATMLVLSAMARDRGVIVSRGQLVEIGGGYRIPDVMAAGGARLVEVGTTNRTHPRDYERAIDEQTALLLRVHTSNYRITGFTREVALDELVEIGRRHGVPVVDDLGSGSLLDTRALGLAAEPLVSESVAAGADLVMFSGDKLLGGPQAGIIVGRADAIERLRRHPLCRALRPGKTTLAGLATTLQHYLRGEAATAVPVWRMLHASEDDLEERARRWCGTLRERLGIEADDGQSAAVDGPRVRRAASAAGGGSLPGETLPTWVLEIPDPHPDRLSDALRRAEVPVIVRTTDGAVTVDPRTVLEEQEDDLLASLMSACRSSTG